MRGVFDYIEQYRFEQDRSNHLTDIDIAELMTQYFYERTEFEKQNKEAAENIREQRKSEIRTVLRQT